MAGFVGLTVIVTLKQGAVIQGFVKAVDPTTASLVLQDAFLPNTRQQVGNWTIQGPSIADLQVVDASSPPAYQNELRNHLQRPSVALTITPQNLEAKSNPEVQKEEIADPAILSYGKKPPVAQKRQAALQEAPATPARSIPVNAVDSLPRANISPFVGTPPVVLEKKSSGRLRGGPAAATLKAPFSNLDINSAAVQEHLDDTDEPTAHGNNLRRVSLTKTRTGKPMDDDIPPALDNSKRRNKKKKRDLVEQAGLDNEAEREDSPDPRRPASNQFRGKGWRQTPMLQDPVSSQPRRSQKETAKARRQKAMDREAQNNGWATEDATDIQELPEFDFVENLSKFDKRTVFDQIRTEDTTADDQRLVHFNKIPARPGTFGGTKLHPTENVLPSPNVAQRADSDSDEGFDLETVKRTSSRASSRRPPYRSGSGIADDAGSIKGFPRTARSLRGTYAGGSSSHGAAGSPIPGRFTPPESPAGSQILGAHFRIASTNRPCPTIMPAGMAAIEEVAETEFGLTTEIMTENAGRGIAEVAMATIGSVTARRNSREQRIDTRPWALIIAGNHKSGARALAACRHLRSRNIRTLTCLLGFDRQTVELERDVRKQVEILVKMNGYVRGWAETKSYLSREGQGPDLIIDATLAASKPFDVLGVEDQKAVVDIVSWARRSATSRGVTISVDMPCGINGSTGEPSVIDSTTAEILQIHTNHIVCIGAPRIGLLRAMQKTALQKAAGMGAGPFGMQYSLELLNAQIWVVDIGVDKAWKRSGLAGSKGVKFDKEWVVPVKLVEGQAEDAR